ncbi:MAG: phage portal protein [Eubacterium sp.]|nr:phage portal protein [Eubacterium sp.]
MGKILDFIKRARERPKNYYSSPSLQYIFGRSASGKIVNERTAMQTVAVYACVRILSEAIASLPLHLYKYGDRGKEMDTTHPLYRILHDEPNSEMTSFIFRETLMHHLLIYGNAYAQILRDGANRVVGLYPLLPNKMEVDRDEKQRLIYKYNRDDEANPNEKEYGTIYFSQEEILHIPGLGFDGLVGYSPIAVAKNAIGISTACDEYSSEYFNNGAYPGGILSTPNVLKNPEQVRASWNEAYGGTGNAHKIAVLEQGMTFQKISLSPEESQFLETRKFQLDEIARIFRIPPHMIGDLEKSSFNNIEQQSLEFVQYTLQPWIIRWEQNLQKALLLPTEKDKYFVKFNVDGLLRGDYASRTAGYASALQNGWMSVNDIRELENLNPLSDEQGGNTYMVNGTMTRLSDVGAAYGIGKEENSNAQE